MPHTWFPTSGVSRRVFNIAIAALLAFATLVIVPGSVPAADATDECGVDVLFVLDASGSMSGTGITEVRNGFNAFLTDLAEDGPTSTVGALHFGTNALPAAGIDYQNVASTALTNYITNNYAAYSDPAYWTNWDAALDRAESGFAAADAVILITDGNPTTWGDGSNRADNFAQWELATTNAVDSANDLKAKTPGTVYGILAGPESTNQGTQSRLAQVVDSGKVTDFAGLTETLLGIVAELCPPGIDIEKSTNGQDADDAPGPSITVGDAVTWTYVVTNTGDVDLTGIVVTDDNGTPGDEGDDVTVTCPESSLIAGADMTCTLEGTAALGQYGNTGTVVDNNNDGPTVSGSDPSHYLGVKRSAPGIDIEKSTNGQDADEAPGPSITVGGQVTWKYVVTNTGSVDLVDIVVTDDTGVIPVFQSGDTGGDGILSVGEVWTYEATGTATFGQYANLGSVTGDYCEDGCLVDDDDQSHYIGVTTPQPPTPGIDIEKWTNGSQADTVPGPSIPLGGQVTWEYVVTNTGEVHLTGVIVTDDILGHVCTIGDLAIGAFDTCTLTGTAVPGQYVNVGTATDNNGIGSTVTDSDKSHYNTPEVAASATIGDTVWSDENENGVQDNGEKGISAATVRLTLPDTSSNQVSTNAATTVDVKTNASGLYLFSGLEAGTYKVELILSSIPKPSEGDLKVTTAGSFTIDLADGESYLDADFGVVATLPKTGIETDQIALIGLALLLAGAVSLLATRRRSDDGTDTAT